MVDIGAARQHYYERKAQRRMRREAERQQWLQRVREAVLHLAPRHPDVRRVYLFGSLVQPDSRKLDPLRLQLVMRKAFALKAVHADQLKQFIDFLRGLT